MRPVFVLANGELFSRTPIAIQAQGFKRFCGDHAVQLKGKRCLPDPFSLHLLLTFRPIVVFPQVFGEVSSAIPYDRDRNHGGNFSLARPAFERAHFPNLA
jgi:hypothetical protein